MKDNIFENMEFLDSLSKEFEKQERIMEPLCLAAKQLELSGIAQYANLTAAVSAQQIGAVGSAYLSGAYQFENTLAQKLQDIYAPLEKVLDNITQTENPMLDSNPITGIIGKETAYRERILRTGDKEL